MWDILEARPSLNKRAFRTPETRIVIESNRRVMKKIYDQRVTRRVTWFDKDTEYEDKLWQVTFRLIRVNKDTNYEAKIWW